MWYIGIKGLGRWRGVRVSVSVSVSVGVGVSVSVCVSVIDIIRFCVER